MSQPPVVGVGVVDAGGGDVVRRLPVPGRGRRAVDELQDKATVSDATWATLSDHLDERPLMDLVFTIGCYGALAMAINTFGIEPDQER